MIPETIEFTVEKKHLVGAVPVDNCNCLLAKAAQEVYPSAEMGSDIIYFPPPITHRYRVSDKAYNLRFNFDQGHNVEDLLPMKVVATLVK